ncbi:MAG: CBS domain-containing protein [Chloroflexota bacterium]
MHIENQVKVADVMTREVVTVAPATAFKAIVRELTERRISALPVVDEAGRVLGVVSEADLLLKEDHNSLAARGGILEPRRRRAERAKSSGATAAEVMSTPAITILPGAALPEAARLMHERHVKRLVVVDEEGRLAGIVTRGDVLKVFLRPDADIKQAVVKDLVERVLWLEANGLEVAVAEGMVTLGGRLDRRSDVAVLARLTEEIDGVVGVVNHLGYDWDDSKAATATLPVSPYWPGGARSG